MFTLKIILLISFSFASSSKITPYLLNGNDAQITEFPYLVSIQEVNVQVCGGSLLSEKWILSGARCFYRRLVEKLIVEYGNTEITPGVNGPRRIELERTIIHENFALTPRSNDIGLAESKVPIVTGFHNTFAKLAPSGNKFNAGHMVVHAGWGQIENGERYTFLQKADFTVLSLNDCIAQLSENSAPPTKKNICVAGKGVICVGDLGE